MSVGLNDATFGAPVNNLTSVHGDMYACRNLVELPLKGFISGNLPPPVL